MKPIVRVEKLSKQYWIGAQETSYGTLRESIVEAARAPLARLRGRNGKRISETIWALKDVTFEVAPGEVIGIIGRNGAGKSTLLKVLSRITEPTTGRVELYGRVASLLEVGTGFHPELTGRENIYLNGAILGMRKAEIVAKFDEIVAFAELKNYLDTPVKRYSSGMYMRLAFAVASHLEPEILIVDEVLAVGDAQFQKKCLGKMGEVAQAGRTVLFVSHNLMAIQGLCDRALWLHEGKTLADGPPHQVVSDYLKTSFSVLTERVWDDVETAPGNEIVRLHRALIRPVNGLPSDPITVRSPFVIKFEYWNLRPETVLHVSFVLSNEQGLIVFASGPVNETGWNGRALPVGLFRSVCHVPGDLLNDGVYRIELLAVKDQSVVIFSYPVLSLEVREAADTRKIWFGKWQGAVRPNLAWNTEVVEINR